MIIRLTSTLTSEDENRVAPAVLKILIELLRLLPVAYSLRIDTNDSHAYEHSSLDDLPRTHPPTTLAQGGDSVCTTDVPV